MGSEPRDGVRPAGTVPLEGAGPSPTGGPGPSPPGPVKAPPPARSFRWIIGVGGFALALFVPWFALAYLYPSPVGIWVPAIPYLLFALLASAVVLGWGLLRAPRGRRWLPAYGGVIAVGVAVGLGVAGVTGLAANVVLGCPSLPPSTSLTPLSDGWEKVPVAAWTSDGRPVLYFFGATWCPYCSASSWAIWKALTEFGTLSGNSTSYSFGPPEPYPYTPEMVLAQASLASATIDFQVTEYNGSIDGGTAVPSTCVQQAYVTSYSEGDIPFLVLNGQYLHLGSLYSPANLSAWNRTNDANGAAYVARSVAGENGTPWELVDEQSWWIMAFLAHGSGTPVATLAEEYGWSASTEQNVSMLVDRLT